MERTKLTLMERTMLRLDGGLSLRGEVMTEVLTPMERTMRTLMERTMLTLRERTMLTLRERTMLRLDRGLSLRGEVMAEVLTMKERPMLRLDGVFVITRGSGSKTSRTGPGGDHQEY